MNFTAVRSFGTKYLFYFCLIWQKILGFIENRGRGAFVLFADDRDAIRVLFVNFGRFLFPFLYLTDVG